MKSKYIPLLVWSLFWLVSSVSAVHQKMPIRTTSEEYGWSIPCGAMALIIFSALFGFIIGADKSEG